MSGYIIKDWYGAKLIETYTEPTLTGISSNAERRKRYWELMEQYAIRLCGYMFETEEKRNKKDLES